MSKVSTDENSIRDTIRVYLLDGLKKGRRYFKSKYIAKDLGLSSKEVGTNLGILSEECEELNIEKWGYSKSTTWKVELKPSA
ncbi:MAG: hypothetical protein SVJ22_11775 [Halobacteriota archaeon]|nr:hypothetical protein [Halobacteriota archaeon]